MIKTIKSESKTVRQSCAGNCENFPKKCCPENGCKKRLLSTGFSETIGWWFEQKQINR